MLQSMGSQRVGHDLVTEQQRCICVYTCICVYVYIYDAYMYIQHTHIHMVCLNKCILNSLFYTSLLVFNDTS